MRSKLFVPACRPELFSKALLSEADGISFDLEDAVPPAQRPQARALLAAFLAQAGNVEGKTLIARINPFGSPDCLADLEAVLTPALDMVNLPKVESAERVREFIHCLAQAEAIAGVGPLPVLLTIESPAGLRCAAELAGCPRVAGLQLGFGDLLEPLGIDREDLATRQHIRLMLRLAAGEAGVAIWDSAWPDISDVEGFYQDACAAHALGFSGKSCIHPSQVTLANRAFMPTERQLAWAARVVEAASRTPHAVCMVDGQMIDAPYLQRAETLLRLAADGSPS
jgi:citrate lyase subunit beta/citryl-CoA lyase